MNLKEMTSLALVVLLIGTIFLPIQSTPLQASILQNPSKIGKNTQYWALVVGIGKYADSPESNRPDMIPEATGFRDLLLQTSWWSADHTRLITAENATRSNIIAGFRWLINQASADDVVVVYLSTHGNQLPLDIPPKDEADGFDEMLVTYWGFAYNTSFITDDTINILLNQLKSNNVCLIVDSCYAGGFNDHWKLLKGAPEQHRVILMGSCEDELSYSGGFAPYLIDGLRGYADSNKDGIVTAEEAFAYAQPRSNQQQHPTIYDGYPGELPLTTDKLQKSSSSSASPQQEDSRLFPTPNTMGISAETSLLCGYVTSSGQPITNALVTVSGRINYQEAYTNSTTTDSTGFYFMHVPAMRIHIIVSAQGYYDRSISNFQIIENHTYWANLSLLHLPLETAVVCGHVSSEQNGTPLAVNVSLQWQGGQADTYENTTVADINGFYQMNVAPGRVNLDFSKDGYFSESRDGLNITDSQMLWENVTLSPYPLETSTVCGYITNSTSGSPLPGVRIDATWVNFSSGHEYTREARTNALGFFSIPIAPGELYIDLGGYGYQYNYYDPYRHDAPAGKPLWMNISLQQYSSISVDIAKPLRALYLNNQRIIPWSSTLIIGPIEIEAASADFFYGPGEQWQVQKIEFYIDGALKATVTTEPYLWDWTAKASGKHTIKVIAYGFHNDTASKEIEVTKLT